jgi:hypothetical protein
VDAFLLVVAYCIATHVRDCSTAKAPKVVEGPLLCDLPRQGKQRVAV